MAKTRTDKQSKKKQDKSVLNGTIVPHKTPHKVHKEVLEIPEIHLMQAIDLFHASEPDRALPLAQRALDLLHSSSVSTLEESPVLCLIGEINLDLGDIDSARQSFLAAASLESTGTEEELLGGGAEKFLWLAQICEGGGRESVEWFQKGASVLRMEIGKLERSTESTTARLLDERKAKLADALCGVVEVYMTDLSWEEDAETQCEQFIEEALLVAPNTPGPLQTLASIRISQLRLDDARAALSRSLELWRDLDSDDPNVPDYSTRVSLARLLMEAEMEKEAMEVLERLVAEDDTSVEAWYLGGWCLHLMGEGRQKETAKMQVEEGKQPDGELTSLWIASREWLSTSLKLYEGVDYEDEKLRDHARDLVNTLNKDLESIVEAGEGESVDDDDEGWEDEDEEEPGSADEKMAGITTEPPVLSSNHPVRKAFHRHGSSAAQHPYVSILVSVAIGVILCYPFPHLYSDSTAGSSSLPHHVWTSTRPFGGTSDTAADVRIRQAWVYGSYMRALETDVLQEALRIQNALLGQLRGYESLQSTGQTLSGATGGLQSVDMASTSLIPGIMDNLGWWFHSPLLYWNCSSSAIASTEDVISTVNRQANQTSPVNMTLRHSTVFAGKTFADHRLVAADALVITLIYKQGLSIGEHWEGRAMALAESSPQPWSLYPKDGKVTRSQLYEFRFQPMSLKDDIFLALAYLCMALYVLISLRKLRAVKSRFGLVITGVTKVKSVCSSFTICAVFNVNLSQIPREIYPLVVLAIGVENMFRLINAVLKTPPEMPTASRIANALGDIGHLSLAAAAQNLFILWLLSKVVSPGVAAFCTFAAVAVVFDFLFHLIFFVAVLSVDVQRLELQDCLDKADTNVSSTRLSDSGRETWGGALVGGKLPFSTRVAGTAIVICSVTTLNWHFLEDEKLTQSPFRLLQLPFSSRVTSRSKSPSILAQSINQARTPTAWLKLQDHNTAREAIRVVKPQAHSFVARVYDPLVFVLQGADRSGNQDSTRRLLAATLRLVREHSFPFALALVLSIAAVTLLMNYLLWIELAGSPDETGSDESQLSVITLFKGHTLDVVMLQSSAKGILASVGLDRSICIWTLNIGKVGFDRRILRTDSSIRSLWPIVAVAVGPCGQWLAICSISGNISLYSLRENRFTQYAKVDLANQQPRGLFLVPSSQNERSILVILPNGRMTAIIIGSSTPDDVQICKTPLLVSRIAYIPKTPAKIVALSKAGCLHLVSKNKDGWISEGKDPFAPITPSNGGSLSATTIVPISILNMVLLVRSCEIDLIDLKTTSLVRTFQTGEVKPQTVRALHSPHRQCLSCGALCVGSFSIVYTELQTQNCIMHTFTSRKKGALICLHIQAKGQRERCAGFECATESLHWIENVSVWEATDINTVIGVRKRSTLGSDPPDGTTRTTQVSASGIFRRIRGPKQPQASPPTPEPDDEWEAWSLSASGDIHTTSLLPPNEQGVNVNEQLFVSKPGPICKLGARSV
ncbi:MAG: hypothetical protein M1835_007821, partial [Candelina submexicana]